MATQLHWYALQSKPREEEAAFHQVRSKGIEVYYPSLRVKTINPRARQVKPYFPCYLFVRLDPQSDEKYVLRWMPHVIGLVSFGDDPASVPDTLIDGIRQHIAEYAALGWDPCSGMKHGDCVVIRRGAFEGYQAIFDTRLSGGDRVRVLLELLSGRSVSVDISAALLRRA